VRVQRYPYGISSEVAQDVPSGGIWIVGVQCVRVVCFGCVCMCVYVYLSVCLFLGWNENTCVWCVCVCTVCVYAVGGMGSYIFRDYDKLCQRLKDDDKA